MTKRALLVLSLLGCHTELPDPPKGRAISGHISYAGQAHRTFEHPALQIAALALVPPPGRPHGALFVDEPDFSRPIAYTLRNLPPWKYKVVARVFDAAHVMDDGKLPTGGFPDFCAFVGGAEGNVPVLDELATTGIDITIYDDGGAKDPCNQGDDVCPKPAGGTLEAILELQRPQAEIKSPDQIVFAVVDDPTKIPPTRFRLLPASTVAGKGFPYTVVINDVPPGSYTVYACYDVGGNSLTGCGPEDFSLVYMDMMRMPIAEAKITTIRMSLDKGTSELVKVDEPSARGCH
jgi:hypothetical protein